jgi:hypothetical protein
MARADSFLVNDNPYFKDVRAINTFIDPHIFNNVLIKNKKLLLQNAQQIDIDERYDYRPDRLAYELYRNDFYYPALLVANNIGSMLQFKADTLNFKCFAPTRLSIQNIIGKSDIELVYPEDVVNYIFKDVTIK